MCRPTIQRSNLKVVRRERLREDPERTEEVERLYDRGRRRNQRRETYAQTFSDVDAITSAT
eukprot:12681413-Heterocapsa_arctica.AAC.1